MADERAKSGFTASERRVWRVYLENKTFRAFVRKRHGKGRLVGPHVRDDLAQPELTATDPDRLSLTEISEHPASEGKVSLCAVKDVWSNRIVEYSINERMTPPSWPCQRSGWRFSRAARPERPSTATATATGAVRLVRAVPGRTRPERAHGMHVSGRCCRRQRGHGIVLRPAPENVLNSRRQGRRDDLRLAIVTWIERTSHRHRRQRVLGELTPIEFESIMPTRPRLRPNEKSHQDPQQSRLNRTATLAPQLPCSKATGHSPPQGETTYFSAPA